MHTFDEINLTNPFDQAQVGMEQGELASAMLNLVHKLFCQLYGGQSLFIVEADMNLYCPHFQDHGQTMCYKR